MGLETKKEDGTDVEKHREYLYKVLVIGDIGVGKTSIIKRYVHGIFSAHYKSTVRSEKAALRCGGPLRSLIFLIFVVRALRCDLSTSKLLKSLLGARNYALVHRL